MESSTKKALAWGAAAAGAGIAYGMVVRPWHRRWGAEPIDIKRPMPGDEIVANANHVTNRAITIDARPGDIWPWLIRMGQRRGDTRIFPRIQNVLGYIEGPGAENVYPDHEKLDEGDVVHIGPAGDLRVEELHKERALVLVPQSLESGKASWSIMLNQFAPEQTRLICRARLQLGWSPRGILFRTAIEPAAFLVFRNWFLGVKERGERTAEQRRSEQRVEQGSKPPVGRSKRQLPPEFNR